MPRLVRLVPVVLLAGALGLAARATVCAWQPNMAPVVFDPASCRDIPAGQFSERGRLAAMLSVHTYAYFGRTDPLPAALSDGVLGIDAAALLLRCDEDPLALSRRRRAIAKLAAYGWPTDFTRELLILGLDLDGFASAVPEAVSPYLLRASHTNRTILEYQFARLLRRRPDLIADSGSDPCGDQPETPYDPPFAKDSPTQISIETYVSVTMPMASVFRNVDPQRWDECSKFWPAPDASMTAPLDPVLGSTYIATETSPDCTLSAAEIVPDKTPPDAGKTYWKKHFFEHFACTVPPCDAEFENLLDITVDEDVHDVYNVGKFWTHRVDYGYPVCEKNGGFDEFDGYIWSRVDSQKPPPKVVLDEGTIDVWTETDAKGDSRTHVRGHKRLKFDNPIVNGTVGVALGFTELNEELAEVACCLKQP